MKCINGVKWLLFAALLGVSAVGHLYATKQLYADESAADTGQTSNDSVTQTTPEPLDLENILHVNEIETPIENFDTFLETTETASATTSEEISSPNVFTQDTLNEANTIENIEESVSDFTSTEDFLNLPKTTVTSATDTVLADTDMLLLQNEDISSTTLSAPYENVPNISSIPAVIPLNESLFVTLELPLDTTISEVPPTEEKTILTHAKEFASEVTETLDAVATQIVDQVTSHISDAVDSSMTFIQDLFSPLSEGNLSQPIEEDALQTDSAPVTQDEQSEKSTAPLEDSIPTDIATTSLGAESTADTQIATSTTLNAVNDTHDTNTRVFVDGKPFAFSSDLVENHMTITLLEVPPSPGHHKISIEITNSSKIFIWSQVLLFGGEVESSIFDSLSQNTVYTLRNEPNNSSDLWVLTSESFGKEFVLLDTEVNTDTINTVRFPLDAIIWQNRTRDGVNGYDTLGHTFFSHSLEDTYRTTVGIGNTFFDITNMNESFDIEPLTVVGEF